MDSNIVLCSHIDSNGTHDQLAVAGHDVIESFPDSPLPVDSNLPMQSTEKLKDEKSLWHNLHQSSKKKVEVVNENSYVLLFMGILTFWTLYQRDIRLTSTTMEADFVFEILISFCFFMFSLEILLQCFYKEGYFNIPTWELENSYETFLEKWYRRIFSFGSFYFWMDVIASFTLIMDMNWMLDHQMEMAFQSSNSTQTAKGANAIRVGARIGRVIRLVRMVRLTRIGKLYKYANQVLCTFDAKSQKEHVKNRDEDENEVEESKIGLLMADLTNRRSVLLF